MITVKLFAYFRDGRGKELEVEHTEGIKVIDIVNQLAIDPSLCAIILINGRHQTLETQIMDKQKLFLFPPVAGG